jgi:hypothetical protein
MHAQRELSATAGEPDQVPRLRLFRAQHPRVVIGTLGLGGAWQARIPQQNGETVLTRYELRDLLDRLDQVLAEQKRDDASHAEAADELGRRADGREQS